jgi:hypothetical protein
MSRKRNPPDLITYADCVRENKALLREEKRLAKLNNGEADIDQLISNTGYAKRLGITGPSLTPSLQVKVRERIKQRQE